MGLADLVFLTKEKVTSIQRLKMCTIEVAMKHITEFKLLLASKSIYDLGNDYIFPWKEGNIIWLDAMGQFFNYLLKRGSARNATGATGTIARSAAAENRHQFTYDGVIGGDMHLYAMHLIF